jgi:hypothetical protein
LIEKEEEDKDLLATLKKYSYLKICENKKLKKYKERSKI